MLKKQYQLLLIITILIASTSQILARTIDIPPSKNLPSNPQQLLKTEKPAPDLLIKDTKKEALSSHSQNIRPEKITKKTLAPHLNFSVSEIGKATTTLGGTQTICSNRFKQTVCLFGKPSPTECAIHYPSFCGKDKQTFCPEPGGYASPTKCPNGHTQATKCPNKIVPTNCPHGITPTNCVSLYGRDSTHPTECPEIDSPTLCTNDDEVWKSPTHCKYDKLVPTYCNYDRKVVHTICHSQGTSWNQPTHCPDQSTATYCLSTDFPITLERHPTTCGTGEIWPTRCPEDDTPYCQPSP